jgi:hypothetical protein
MGGNDDGETMPQTRPAVGAIYASGIVIGFIFRTQNDNPSLVLFEFGRERKHPRLLRRASIPEYSERGRTIPEM